jgi:hypothetical protein
MSQVTYEQYGRGLLTICSFTQFASLKSHWSEWKETLRPDKSWAIYFRNLSRILRSCFF